MSQIYSEIELELKFESQMNKENNNILELLSIDLGKKKTQNKKTTTKLYLTPYARRKSKCIKDLKA